MILTTRPISDEELLSQIIKWQDNPKKYTNLLIEQVYPTIYELSRKTIYQELNKTEKRSIEITASSVVNESFLKLKNGPGFSEMETLRNFYDHLRTVVRAVLIDRERTLNAKKRVCDIQSSEFKKRLYPSTTRQAIKANFTELDKGIQQLKKLDPEIAEALAIRFINAKTVDQTAKIMERSKATTERMLSTGQKLLNAIIRDEQFAA